MVKNQLILYKTSPNKNSNSLVFLLISISKGLYGSGLDNVIFPFPNLLETIAAYSFPKLLSG